MTCCGLPTVSGVCVVNSSSGNATFSASVSPLHSETSTGVLNDIELLNELTCHYGARLCLDCISSIGVLPVEELPRPEGVKEEDELYTEELQLAVAVERADLAVERGVDELRALGLHAARRHHLQQPLAGVDQAAAVAAHVQDQPLLRKLRDQADELVHELVGVGQEAHRRRAGPLPPGARRRIPPRRTPRHCRRQTPRR